MAMMTGSGGDAYQSNINITPLVDVVLVLLIIFMVVSPQARRWYEVHLAKQGVAAESEAQAAPSVTLAISGEDCPLPAGPKGDDLPGHCRVRVNREPIALADLNSRIDTLYRERHGEDRVLFISVEDRFNYEVAMRIIDQASSGVEGLKIGYAVQPGENRSEF